jgi:hypothetical protein
MSKKIYVASSWRNIYQPEVLKICRLLGHDPYDFRSQDAFSWRDVDPDFESWRTHLERYREKLDHPLTKAGYAADMAAIVLSDVLLMVYPAGRSAHLELGWAVGAGKKTAILFPQGMSYPKGDEAMKIFGHHNLSGVACAPCGDIDGCWMPGKLRRDFEPETMSKMAGEILIGKDELEKWLRKF